ncbi:hypothetical protein QR680_003386 [Steinernema hermaphroditum]|uniref:Nuclear receptor domain-containing protein n=1 Tax=Steinernema hermaphroditum TaxID=289476 RepID=A0AA39LJM4_9BILA|nr:hypothetical protein QR680_003386 [Steinernema hermaphroditum]
MSSDGRQDCRVCGGVANGYHFGAMSCAACNAFFRRSIAEKRKYICRKDGDCEVNPNARCFCRACRLKKCFMVGMDAKAVQPHRDIIGKKPKKRPPSESSPPIPDIEAKSEAPLTIDNSFLLTNVTNSNSAFSIPTSSSKTISTTATPTNPTATTQPLDSPNSFAEQLLAFSRQPVIATTSTVPATSKFLDLTPQPVRDIYASAVAETSRATTSTQPIFSTSVQSQPVITHAPYSYEECRPVPLPNPYNLADPKPINPTLVVQPTSRKETNMIDDMISAYRKMVERRRMISCPPTLRDILGGTPPILTPSYFGCTLKKDTIRLQVALLVELVNSIAPFSMLSVDDKILLFRNVSVPFNLLEKHYITMICGGLDNKRLIQSDFTYIDVSPDAPYRFVRQNGDVAAPNPNPFLEVEEMRRIVLPTLRSSLEEIARPMYHLGMTDTEFVALVLIVLLNPDIAGLSQIARNTIGVARNRLYKDWFAYYEKNGVGDGQLKVGNSLLILPALQSAVEKVTGNFHMVRVFGLVDYDRILDDVFK